MYLVNIFKNGQLQHTDFMDRESAVHFNFIVNKHLSHLGLSATMENFS